MILFKDILKEAFGKMTEESDFIDSDFQGIEDGTLRAEDLADLTKEDQQENPDEEIKAKRPLRMKRSKL